MMGEASIPESAMIVTSDLFSFKNESRVRVAMLRLVRDPGLAFV